jgi:hypothetical protein
MVQPQRAEAGDLEFIMYNAGRIDERGIGTLNLEPLAS